MGQPRRRHTIEEDDRTRLAERFQHAGIACSLLSAVILLFSVFGGRADTNAAARSASSSPGRETVAAEGTDRPVFLARNWDEEIYPAAESAEAAGKLAELVPVLEGKAMVEGRPTAFVCRDRVCKLPSQSVEALAAELSAGE